MNGDRLAGFQRINVIVPPLAAANIVGAYFSRQHQAFLHDIVPLIACSGCFQFPMPYARPVAFGLQKLDRTVVHDIGQYVASGIGIFDGHIDQLIFGFFRLYYLIQGIDTVSFPDVGNGAALQVSICVKGGGCVRVQHALRQDVFVISHLYIRHLRGQTRQLLQAVVFHIHGRADTLCFFQQLFGKGHSYRIRTFLCQGIRFLCFQIAAPVVAEQHIVPGGLLCRHYGYALSDFQGFFF